MYPTKLLFCSDYVPSFFLCRQSFSDGSFENNSDEEIIGENLLRDLCSFRIFDIRFQQTRRVFRKISIGLVILAENVIDISTETEFRKTGYYFLAWSTNVETVQIFEWHYFVSNLLLQFCQCLQYSPKIINILIIFDTPCKKAQKMFLLEIELQACYFPAGSTKL